MIHCYDQGKKPANNKRYRVNSKHVKTQAQYWVLWKTKAGQRLQQHKV